MPSSWLDLLCAARVVIPPLLPTLRIALVIVVSALAVSFIDGCSEHYHEDVSRARAIAPRTSDWLVDFTRALRDHVCRLPPSPD